MSQIENIRDKKDIRKWWSDNPMTYGGTHGKTDYGDGTPEFEFGTREFYQKVDATFYSLAGDYGCRCARVQCRFYDRSTFSARSADADSVTAYTNQSNLPVALATRPHPSSFRSAMGLVQTAFSGRLLHLSTPALSIKGGYQVKAGSKLAPDPSILRCHGDEIKAHLTATATWLSASASRKAPSACPSIMH